MIFSPLDKSGFIFAVSTLWGKITSKFDALAKVAKSGNYIDLTNKPDIPTGANNLTTTEVGKYLDATQGKILNDEIAELNRKLNDLTTIIVPTVYLANTNHLSITSGTINMVGRVVSIDVSIKTNTTRTAQSGVFRLLNPKTGKFLMPRGNRRILAINDSTLAIGAYAMLTVDSDEPSWFRLTREFTANTTYRFLGTFIVDTEI